MVRFTVDFVKRKRKRLAHLENLHLKADWARKKPICEECLKPVKMTIKDSDNKMKCPKCILGI